MNKKFNRAIVSSSVACLVVTSLAAVPVFAAPPLDKAGNNRIETAIKIAEASWNGAWKGSTTAVLASGNDANLVDALAIAPLAYAKQAPILLSRQSKDAVDAATLKEIKDRKVEKIYLAAGTGVLSEKVEAQLKAAGVKDIVRLGGSNRYETAKNINKELGSYSKVAVVNGEVGLADAISVASIAANQGMAIAMTPSKDSVPDMDLTGKTVYALGGSGVLSDAVVSKMGATRFGGSSRYETNAKVIEGLKANLKFDTVYLADGANNHLVDSLTGSVLAAQTASPIVLSGDQLDPKQKEVLKNNVTKDTKLAILSEDVDNGVVSAITEAVTEATSGANTKPADKVVAYNEHGSSKNSSNSEKPVIQDTIPSTLTKILAIDTNTFVLEFSSTVDSVSVKNVNNFIFDKNIKVVNTDLDSTGKKVTLTTDDAKAGTVYTLTMENIKNSDGKTMQKTPYTITAVEDRTSPEVASIKVEDSTITIKFNDEHGMDKTALENKDNYLINGIGIKEVKACDENKDSLYETLVITTDKLNENMTYALTMNNLTDASVLKNSLKKVNYEFKGPDHTPPTVVSVSPNSTTSSAIVVLSEKLDVQLDGSGKGDVTSSFKVVNTDHIKIDVSKAEYDDANMTITFTLSGVANGDVLTTDNTVILTDLSGNQLVGDIAVVKNGTFVIKLNEG